MKNFKNKITTYAFLFLVLMFSKMSVIRMVEGREDQPTVPTADTCSEVLGENVVMFIKIAFTVFPIIASVLLVVMSMLDFTKAVASSNADTMKKSWKNLIIRIVVTIVIFLLPYIVELIGSIAGWDTSCLS